jgi:hypothetical protein
MSSARRLSTLHAQWRNERVGEFQGLHVVSVDAGTDTGWEKGATIQLKKIVDERLAGKVDYQFVVSYWLGG